ncbi:methanobactin export MATE transporter MbnM [Yoonia sediminilitoris]|uniref:Cytochrome c peroxidase n=1 Tax=Yoonia sediminilitoris TaxID=1286148 RepID=A0A2T6KHC1_9RHOB|nr:methanobactin export MATE transporter MbnM [Yoonia sediminilitoris]PUB14885.1 cytochrome c peroxidase [Yoonia sediminilitoris]RCW95602.1 cytochrome c peroxidase [Yoonia sediminilitoris]
MRTAVLWAAAILLSGATTAPAEGYDWDLPDWMPRPAIPEDNPMTAEKVALGRHLFYDARLSADGTVACSSCHDQTRAFTDGRETAIGIDGTSAGKNAPPLMNVAYFPVLTWANPHMTTLEFQALVPLFCENPQEMGGGGQETAIFARLRGDPYYASAFAKAFPNTPDPDLFTVTRALAAFQRSLMSFDAPYDRFKYGSDLDALSPAAQRGEQLFFDHRFECYHCHQGVMFSDNFQTEGSPWSETGFHNTGLYSTYPAELPGLIEFTGQAEDAGRFRTPSLRNIAVTAPYMHDGSIPDLRGVLDHYAKGGREGHAMQDGMIVGFDVTSQEMDDLVAFLESLTDDAFLTNPAHSDPWPANHPARVNRADP